MVTQELLVPPHSFIAAEHDALMKTYLNDGGAVLGNTILFQEDDAYPRIKD